MRFRLWPRRAVTVRITGGLGNQMFQYAAGLSVARRLGVPLLCDTQHYLTRHERTMQLRAFGLRIEEADAPSLLERWWPAAAPAVVTYRSEYQPELLTARAPLRLEGWFPLWRYLGPVTDELRSRFDTVRLPLSSSGEAFAGAIDAAASPVAVHVRRGDYVQLADMFNQLALPYYNAARNALEPLVSEPSYFVFSDESKVAAALLRWWPRVTIVSGLSDLEDFRLMSSCRHFIIANSTFSWWAAWLGRGTDKIVVAPATWAGPGSLARGRYLHSDERYPPGWMRV